MQQAKLPDFGHLSSYGFSKDQSNPFASNLTISWGGFCNVPHKDHDKKGFFTSGRFFNSFLKRVSFSSADLSVYSFTCAKTLLLFS